MTEQPNLGAGDSFGDRLLAEIKAGSAASTEMEESVIGLVNAEVRVVKKKPKMIGGIIVDPKEVRAISLIDSCLATCEASGFGGIDIAKDKLDEILLKYPDFAESVRLKLDILIYEREDQKKELKISNPKRAEIEKKINVLKIIYKYIIENYLKS